MNKLKLYGNQHSQSMGSQTKVISIISGKGGVGKSVLAFNLAERIAAMKGRILLVDADLNCGNLHILANVRGDYGITEFILGELSLKEAVTKIDKHFDLLAANHSDAAFVDGDITPVARMMPNLRKQGTGYDIVMVDQGSGISKTATVIAHTCDVNLLLLVPEITSISDCYGLYKHLSPAEAVIDWRLLVNRVESESEAEYIYSKFCALSERFFQHSPQYLGFVREDALFRKCLASQIPLSRLGKESIVVHQLMELAGKLMGEHGNFLKDRKIAGETAINKTLAVADTRK